MTQRSNNAQNEPCVSDERLRNALRRQIDRAYNAQRSTTRQQLSTESGVNVFTIDAIMSNDAAKQRRVKLEDAFSIVFTLGERAVNGLIAEMGYTGARKTDAPDPLRPMQLAAKAMAHLSTIATCAADDVIDYREEPICRDAADQLIATVLPMSSAGERRP